MSYLGVNIDHIATIRQARGTFYPDPASAARLAELGGAHSIVCHLREDRRHIQDDDVFLLRKFVTTKLTLEMAVTEEMLKIASDLKPNTACFVPEKREELTTEGGLDVKGRFQEIKEALHKLQSKNILVSLFIDPDCEQIGLAKEAGATMIELHTGIYCEAAHKNQELDRLVKAAQFAESLGLICNAGHGIDYSNVQILVSYLKQNKIMIHEYNIGHSIIARSLFTGIQKAVTDMRNLIREAEKG
ncbi:MAG: pyridoxine 5'-phosphate synthase [Deltaproteobacteria bacterium]|nr:pyridoxine 5'-phosphate synthase [Deltaproteobacteria bacterium]